MGYDTTTERTIFLQEPTENSSDFYVDFTKACGPFLLVEKNAKTAG